MSIQMQDNKKTRRKPNIRISQIGPRTFVGPREHRCRPKSGGGR